MSSLVRASIDGARIGATAGAPFRGATKFKKVHFYEPIPMRQVANESFDAWVVFANHLRANYPKEAICDALRKHWTYNTNEDAFAQRNWQDGYAAPLSGSLDNPLSSGSSALGRAAFWGTIFTNDLDAAAEHCFYDASSDHSGVGVLAAVAVARIAAAAQPTINVSEFAKIALAIGAKNDRMSHAVRIVIKAASQNEDPEELHRQLWESIAQGDVFDAVLNFGFVLGSLLMSRGVFDDAVCLSSGWGGASDQTSLAVGSICAKLQGSAATDWLNPIGDACVYGHGLRDLELPSNSQSLADLLHSVVPTSEVTEPISPLVVSSELQEEGPSLIEQSPVKPVLLDPSLSPSLASLLDRPAVSTYVIGAVILECEFIESPYAHENRSVRLVLRFRNPGDSEITCEPVLSAPRGWKVAEKLASFRLPPGAMNEFPVVVQPPQGITEGSTYQLKLKCGNQISIPIRTASTWYRVGPFANPEGTGFDAHYRPEDTWDLKAVFNGRSHTPVKWQPVLVSGPEIDLEPSFSSGAGVVFLYSRMTLPTGRLRFICAASVGAVVWINRTKVISYHDTHHPTWRAVLPYVAEFECTGETHLLIKVLRNTIPIEPLTLYFLNEEGEVVLPLAMHSM